MKAYTVLNLWPTYILTSLQQLIHSSDVRDGMTSNVTKQQVNVIHNGKIGKHAEESHNWDLRDVITNWKCDCMV